jgi:hypothetical protein
VPTNLVRSTCLNAASTTCNLTQCGGSIISNTLVTPQGRTLLSALPAPNSGIGDTTTNNYVGSGTGNNDGDQADGRLDFQVNQNLHAFGRYDYSIFCLFGHRSSALRAAQASASATPPAPILCRTRAPQ